MQSLLRTRKVCVSMMIGLLALFPVADRQTNAKEKKQTAKKGKPNRRRIKTAFLDPKKAGPDFQVQGEYAGQAEPVGKVGAQVIALGDGKFDVVLYVGGLPGAGWDGKTKYRLKGTRRGKETNCKGTEISGLIVKGVFEGSGKKTGPFRLTKVHRRSPTLNAKPPKNALVLFDGTNTDQWENGKIEEGHLLGVGTRTKKKFRDFTLHLEFRTPFMPYARGQARGNSGMYLLDQYECQILDSFGLEGKSNECGGIYKVAAPRVNMCFPPLSWQTYDVEFKAARFDAAGKKISDAVVTIRHNGVVIHKNRKLKVTPGGHQNDERPGRLYLQNHGDPVRFRNIWIVEQ